MEKFKVSIIVPVYNVEKYLEECISSIIKQSYQNIEIILVNDGSKDSSGKICDEYAKKDKRIKVIHQKNSGVSTTRNKGIELATGEYIAFIDSDDVINENYIQILVSRMSSKKQVVCRMLEFNGDIPSIEYSDKPQRIILKRKDFFELSKMALVNTPCCKLYSSKIINEHNISFDEMVSIGEDLLFNLEYLKYIEEIEIIDEFLYFYRRGNSNSLTTIYNPLAQKIHVQLFDEYTNFYHDKIRNINDRKYFDTNRLYMIIAVVQNEFRNKEISFFKRYLNARSVLSSKDIKKRLKKISCTNEKLTHFLLLHNMCFIYKVINKLKSILKDKR